MAVYLDANVLPADTHVAALGFSVVRAVAQASGQSIVVPAIALEEAVARREREIADSQREAQQIFDRWRRMGIEVAPPVLANSHELAKSWEAQLAASVTVLPTPAGALEEGIRREIYRIPPAREGRGVRDVTIWLTSIEHHKQLAERSFFVTQNTKDFADPNNRTLWNPSLMAEMGAFENPFEFCNSFAHLLDRLATSTKVGITADALAGTIAARSAVIAFISGQDFLSRILLEPTSSMLFVASPVEAVPVTVSTGETYRAGQIEVGVVWTTWRINFTLGVLLSHARGSFSQELRPITIEANMQLWLRRQGVGESWSEAEVSALGSFELQRA